MLKENDKCLICDKMLVGRQIKFCSVDCKHLYFHKENREKSKEYDNRYYQKNKEIVLECRKKYRQNNKEKVTKCKNSSFNKRYKADPIFRLNRNI